MKEDLVEITCLIDRSGSMAALRSDAVGGFNTFVEEQRRLPGEARLTLVLFNERVEVVHLARPIGELEALDEGSYVPQGSTALYDAVGRTIDKVGERLAATPEAERPGKVIVAILTDGLENASRRYSASAVRERIERQRRDYKWEFVSLGANQDAFAEAEKLAIPFQDGDAFVKGRTTSQSFARADQLGRPHSRRRPAAGGAGYRSTSALRTATISGRSVLAISHTMSKSTSS